MILGNGKGKEKIGELPYFLLHLPSGYNQKSQNSNDPELNSTIRLSKHGDLSLHYAF